MKALVTGATGFLGGALTRRLQHLGWEVTALGRNPSALTEIKRQGINAVQADLTDGPALQRASQGHDLVFHVGALSSPWGPAQSFYKANVLGTENIIRACVENHVQRLIYVSTPSIYFRYQSRLNVREDADLPPPVNEYATTKRLAEAKIDEAFQAGLPVITIRPRAIFGPRDTSILPRLIDRLQKGQLRIIGDGNNLTDLTYVENVVDALLLCAASPDHTLGKKYNITNGEPTQLWDMINKVSQALDLKPPTGRIPYPVAHTLAGLLELIYRMLPNQPEPPFTRYSVFVLAQTATLDITAARRELDYIPRVSIADGFQHFIHWWKANESR